MSAIRHSSAAQSYRGELREYGDEDRVDRSHVQPVVGLLAGVACLRQLPYPVCVLRIMMLRVLPAWLSVFALLFGTLLG
jgi:hypothetical protein